MNQLRRSFYYIFLSIDILSVIGSFFFAILISKSRLPVRVIYQVNKIRLTELFTLLVLLISWYLFSRSVLLYDEFKTARLGPQIGILTKCISGQAVIGILLLFFLKDIVLSRFFLVTYLVSLTGLLLLERSLFRLIRMKMIKTGRLKKRIILIGSGEGGKSYVKFLEKVMSGEFIVTGYSGDRESSPGRGIFLGKLANVQQILSENSFDLIVISLSESENSALAEILRATSSFPVKVRIVPDYYKFVSNKYQLSFVNNLPVVDLVNDPLEELHWKIVKRLFDITFSLFIILFFLSWIFPLIALLIKLDSKGPVLYRQDRLGKKNKIFSLMKFRSMITGSSESDQGGKFRQTSKNDKRITRIGRFLRKTSIDELPQFFNVLKGEMSVVGPRPHAVKHNLESQNRIENYMQRHLVKPGITGWAQVNGFRGETRTDEEMRKRVEYDMIYIENWSIGFDIKIIIQTIWRLFKGDPEAY